VVAYEDKVSPSGVGYDIACGNKAVLTDIPAAEVRANIKSIMDDIWSHLSFGIGRKNQVRVDHELFEDPAWSIRAIAQLKSMASQQLGTIGSGNHYVDLLEDEQGRIWIGVHFGSRGFGHKTATHFLNAGGASDNIHADPLVLDVRSHLGADYLACMALAGRYAYAGRDWVCSEVAKLLGANILDEVHNHHNFAWQEVHQGIDLWVVRKGATPAFPGQRGFVGGSMGDISVILEGVESEESALALYSTVHGAGAGDEPHRSPRQDQPQDGGDHLARAGLARDDDGMDRRARGGAARRRHGRIAALLQAAARRAGAPRRHHPHSAHPQTRGRRHGRRKGIRPLQGLIPPVGRSSQIVRCCMSPPGLTAGVEASTSPAKASTPARLKPRLQPG
jgi:hypothetical protein